MSVRSKPRYILVSHAAPEAYAPMSQIILAKLGYAVVTPEEYRDLADEFDLAHPDLRIVDERNLAEVPEESGPQVPLVVLTGRYGVTGADPRIIGAVRRPAGMHDLFRLLQQVLEDTPRATPRVPTHLAARCRRGDREWRVSVLSLSENGCLIRTPEALTLGMFLELDFTLPRSGELCCGADVAYQLLPDLGLVFNAVPSATRRAIANYVSEALALNPTSELSAATSAR